jgi:hypothetical protein
MRQGGRAIGFIALVTGGRVDVVLRGWSAAEASGEGALVGEEGVPGRCTSVKRL